MKTIVLLLWLTPCFVWAQADSVQTLRRGDLKPIGSDLVPAYYGRYGQAVRTQYTYDGLDIKAKQLIPYIIASGDADAIREINRYRKARQTGRWLIASGLLSMIVGTAIMASNRPDPDGRFTTQQAYVCPSGFACGSTITGQTVYGGQVAGYQSVPDVARRRASGAGFITLLGGSILTGIGWGLNLPGQRVRRAVQYYNRSLERGPRTSWRLQPGAATTVAGLTLSGQF